MATGFASGLATGLVGGNTNANTVMDSGASKDPSLAMSGVKVGNGNREMRMRPQFADRDIKIPIPTKADFAYLDANRISFAVSAGLTVTSPWDTTEFLKGVGMGPLFTALLNPTKGAGTGEGSRDLQEWNIDAIKVPI